MKAQTICLVEKNHQSSNTGRIVLKLLMKCLKNSKLLTTSFKRL